MGGGSWMYDTYATRASVKKAAGIDDFDYDARAKASGVMKPHATLDPKGLKLRESRDSTEHPLSNAVSVMFDVTGSMADVPRVLQKKLPGLLGTVLRKGYLSDPQFLMGAIGDATCDRVPLQVGQFESDNRLDENLENIILEGGGGGQNTESYELAMYTMARHTAMDCFEKRGRKGYLFLMGDELPYPVVRKDEVLSVIGDTIQDDIAIKDIVSELKQKFHVFFIIPSGASNSRQRWLVDTWKELLGDEYVLRLQDDESVCETITMAIGINEEAIDLDEGTKDLLAMGMNKDAVLSASKALAPLSASKGSVAKVSGSGLPVPSTGGKGKTKRL